MIQADICRYYSGFVYLRLLPAALYTSHDCFGLFSILSRYWVQFFVSNSTKLCSKLGGGADVCPLGVSRTEDVDREVQCWAYPYPLGRRMMVDTCCYYSGFVYLRFLSAVQGLQKHSWAFLLSRGKFFRFWFPIWAQFWFLWLNGHSTPLSSYTSPCGIQIFSSSSCAIWFGLL